MQYYVSSGYSPLPEVDCWVVGVYTGGVLSTAAMIMDKISQGYLTKVIQRESSFGEVGQSLLLHEVPELGAARLLLVGCGQEIKLTASSFRKIVGKSITALKAIRVKQLAYGLTELTVKGQTTATLVRSAVEVIADNFYRFTQFKTKNVNADSQEWETVYFQVPSNVEPASVEPALAQANAINTGITLTKNLSNLPANICTPTYLAEQATKLAKTDSAFKITVLEAQDMQTLGMGALLAVAKGSHQPPKLITLRYQGAAEEAAPIVLIGKGITFDSGGISLKPAANMEEMKFDMCGAASVLGVLQAVAQLKLKVNIIGVIPTTENMPGGQATRPGDIVTTMSGQTVEILNTDAEGRLILCDALTYSAQFKPAAVIDIATLTGAIITTLGSAASGLMGNHQPLLDALQTAGEQSGDAVWPLPVWEEYQELIESNVADIANIGSGNGAKSIVAACFLARFAEQFQWAHLDIAGTAWKSGKDKTATGRPVPLLVQYLINYCAQQA